MIFSPDGSRLVGQIRGPNEPTVGIQIWDIATGQQLLNLQPKTTESFRQAALSSDGRRLAAGIGIWDANKEYYVAGEVKIWDTGTNVLRNAACLKIGRLF